MKARGGQPVTRPFLILATVLAAGIGSARAEPAEAVAAPLKCDIGPVHRTFGGTNWIVYSCADKTSMVIVSDKGNPAAPFVFVLKSEGGAYAISGEGNGESNVSDTAGDALEKMTPAEFAALLAATKAAAAQP